MNKIEISSLVPGSIAQSDLFSQDGELLVKQGTCITKNHLAIMKRRNIYDIFAKNDTEEDELHNIMSKKFGELEELDLDEIAQNIIDKTNPVNTPKKIVIPAEFADLKPCPMVSSSSLIRLQGQSSWMKPLDMVFFLIVRSGRHSRRAQCR